MANQPKKNYDIGDEAVSQIEMSLSKLRAKAKEVDRLKLEHHEEMRRMRNLILGLNTIWQGEAENALVARFLSMSQELIDFESNLGEYAGAMRRAADETEKLDKEIALRIRRI